MSTANQLPGSADEQRPEFMVLLGLLPPYALEDVKQAYRAKVQSAHPDRGGSLEHFRSLQQAYEQAQEYVKFCTSRRAWIAAQMEKYLVQQEVESKLQSYGADVVTHISDWLQKSYGDFAELTTSMAEIRLVDSEFGRDALDLIVVNHRVLASLKRLVLRQCHLSDDDVLRLTCFQLLEHLDVGGNPVTGRSVDVAVGVPTLKSMVIDDTAVGLWGRTRLALLLRRRQGEITSPLTTP
jgi:hypothetical protein